MVTVNRPHFLPISHFLALKNYEIAFCNLRGTIIIRYFMHKDQSRPEAILLSEIQVLLAEKRTYFSILRTGFGIITIPYSIIAFLLATAAYNRVFDYPWLGGTVVFGLLILSLSGVYISEKSRRKIFKIDALIRTIEAENSRVNEIMV